MNIPVLLQTDPRWQGQRLGTENGATIGSFGCAVTCITMKNYYYGGREGWVNTIDDIFTNRGVYTDGSGHYSPTMGCDMIVWERIHNALPHVEHIGTGFYDNSPADLARIKASIDRGHPVTLQVNWLGRANHMHFVEAYAYQGDDIIVNCPEKGGNMRFSSRQYGTGNAATDILRAHFFNGPAPVGVAAPQSAPVAKPQPAPVVNPAPVAPQEVQVTLAEHQAAIVPLNQKIADLTRQLADTQGLLAKQSDTITALNQEVANSVPEYVHSFVDGPVIEALTTQAVTIQDFSGLKPPTDLEANMIVELRGLFSVGGTIYYRTNRSVQGSYYYGVPSYAVKAYNSPAGSAPVLDAAAGQAALTTAQSVHAMAADGLNGWGRFISKLGLGGKK